MAAIFFALSQMMLQISPASQNISHAPGREENNNDDREKEVEVEEEVDAVDLCTSDDEKMEENKNQKNKIVHVSIKVLKNINEKVMTTDPVVELEPGLEPSPSPESKSDVLDDDEEAKGEEEKEENPDDEGGYPDDNDEPLDQEYYERESFYADDDDSPEEENIVLGACRNIRDILTEEYLTSYS